MFDCGSFLFQIDGAATALSKLRAAGEIYFVIGQGDGGDIDSQLERAEFVSAN